MAKPPLLQATDRGLYCEHGDFYIDPWRKVDRAIITHGHSDHARPGMGNYLCSAASLPILRHRLSAKAIIEGLDFSTPLRIGDVVVSFHPNGHILGSSQIRIEHDGEVWVVSGDYKRDEDSSCEAFEPVRCHTFITESTFALPIYRWRPVSEIATQMNAWWRLNQSLGIVTIFSGYPLGKSQRIQSLLDPSIGKIHIDANAAVYSKMYENAGVSFPEYSVLEDAEAVAPGSAVVLSSSGIGPELRQRFKCASAFVSGWMQIRKDGRSRSGMGFALSDHADWPALLKTIEETGAEKIFVTHGYTKELTRYLRELGKDADVLPTHFERE